MIIDIAKIARNCKIKLPDLITRPVGRSLYAAVKEKLEFVGAGETVLLDFEGVKVIDSSCVDELIVRLIQDSYARYFYIKLRNVSPIS